MLAGSTAGPCQIARCRDVGVKQHLLPSGLSPTILLPLGCHRQITPCSIGAGCPFLMYLDRVALPDAQNCLVLLDVAAGYSFLMMELLVLADVPSSWCRR